MADGYQRLPGGPALPEEELLLDRKCLGITLRTYSYFFGSIIVATLLNIIFRDYLF